MKRKEIKFRDLGYVLEGRRGSLTFALYDDNSQTDPDKRTYSVVVRHKDIESLGFNTAGHRSFTLEGAKEFCQKIAAGEIDPEALLMEFAAEDIAKEQAAIRDVTERAKKFRARLEAVGLKYTDLLELEVLRHNLGDMASLAALDVRLTHCYLVMSQNPEGCFTTASGRTVAKTEAVRKLDAMAQSLGEKIDQEETLIRNTMESDRKRK